MITRICCITLLLLFCLAGLVTADTYTLQVPVAGYGSSHLMAVDFGCSFASIQGLQISWSGHVNPTWFHDPISGLQGPWGGQFGAYLRDGTQIAKKAYTPSYGGTTYPDSEYFSTTSQFSTWMFHNSWDFLLDGQADMYVQFAADVWTGGGGSTPPTGALDSPVTLVLDATPVPEPAGLACLISGAVAIMPLVRRRR